MEIIRRYYDAIDKIALGEDCEKEALKIELLMRQAKITTDDRKVTVAAKNRAEELGVPVAALELADGTILTGKTTDLLGASAALLLNALKHLAGIDDETHLIARLAIEPIQDLKVRYLGSRNPRLHTDEVLIALSSCATTDPNAKLAISKLPELAGAQVHTSVMLSDVDKNVFKKLGMQLTSEPVIENKRIY